MMNTAEELQAKIIKLVSNITDINQLSAIHVDLQTSLGREEHLVNLRRKTTFEYLRETQREKSITFDEVCKLADGVAWEQSTEELLAQLS